MGVPIAAAKPPQKLVGGAITADAGREVSFMLAGNLFADLSSHIMFADEKTVEDTITAAVNLPTLANPSAIHRVTAGTSKLGLSVHASPARSRPTVTGSLSLRHAGSSSLRPRCVPVPAVLQQRRAGDPAPSRPPPPTVPRTHLPSAAAAMQGSTITPARTEKVHGDDGVTLPAVATTFIANPNAINLPRLASYSATHTSPKTVEGAIINGSVNPSLFFKIIQICWRKSEENETIVINFNNQNKKDTLDATIPGGLMKLRTPSAFEKDTIDATIAAGLTKPGTPSVLQTEKLDATIASSGRMRLVMSRPSPIPEAIAGSGPMWLGEPSPIPEAMACFSLMGLCISTPSPIPEAIAGFSLMRLGICTPSSITEPIAGFAMMGFAIGTPSAIPEAIAGSGVMWFVTPSAITEPIAGFALMGLGIITPSAIPEAIAGSGLMWLVTPSAVQEASAGFGLMGLGIITPSAIPDAVAISSLMGLGTPSAVQRAIAVYQLMGLGIALDSQASPGVTLTDPPIARVTSFSKDKKGFPFVGRCIFIDGENCKMVASNITGLPGFGYGEQIIDVRDFGSAWSYHGLKVLVIGGSIESRTQVALDLSGCGAYPYLVMNQIEMAMHCKSTWWHAKQYLFYPTIVVDGIFGVVLHLCNIVYFRNITPFSCDHVPKILTGFLVKLDIKCPDKHGMPTQIREGRIVAFRGETRFIESGVELTKGHALETNGAPLVSAYRTNVPEDQWVPAPEITSATPAGKQGLLCRCLQSMGLRRLGRIDETSY